MKKRFSIYGKKNFAFALTVLLALAFFVSFPIFKTEASNYWSDSLIRASSFAGGGGSVSNPYQISTPEQLGYFAYLVNGSTTYATRHYELKNSLNMSGNNWKPITATFRGTLNGNGYVISGLKIVPDSSDKNVGFFSSTNGAVVSNLTLEGSINVSDKTSVGGFVGDATNTTFTEVANNISIIANNTLNLGGIEGSSKQTYINRSYNIASIKTESIHYIAGIGGLSGNLEGGSDSRLF